MSGQQIGTVVGTIAGFWLPGGPSVWGTIGGYVGGVISPTVLHGPSIGDAQTQTSMAGMPIPKCYGRPPPIAPTVIDGDKIARKVTREQGGKGATTVSETEGFIATRAFLVCEGEIAAYARIKRNGKLVYSTVPGDELDAQSAAFGSQLTIYTGSQTQGPDPSLEAIHGVGNTPYYRGRSYFVVRDDDETQTGGTPNQYRIEVAQCGSIGYVSSDNGIYASLQSAGYLRAGHDALDWPNVLETGLSPGTAPTLVQSAAGRVFHLSEGVGRVSTDRGFSWQTCGGIPDGVAPRQLMYARNMKRWLLLTTTGLYDSLDGVGFSPAECPIPPGQAAECLQVVSTAGGDILLVGGSGFILSTASGVWTQTLSPGGEIRAFGLGASGTVIGVGTAGVHRSVDYGLTWSSISHPLPASAPFTIACSPARYMMLDSGGNSAYSDDDGVNWDLGDPMPEAVIGAGVGKLIYDGTRFVGARQSIHTTADGTSGWVTRYDGSLAGVEINSLAILDFTGAPSIPDVVGYYIVDDTVVGPGTPKVSDCSAQWRDIAADIAERAHPLLADQLDIGHMTDDVPGFVLGNASLTGTDYMRTLCTLYFVDGSEYDDQWHAVRRGGAIVGTLAEDDLLAIEEEDDDTRDQALNGFRRVTVMYPDPANNYVPTPQTAPRTSPDITANNEVTIECPIPFDADTMAQKADILQKIAFLQLEGSFKRNFRAEYSRYVTSDPVVFKGRRYILNKVANDDSMVRFDGTYDRVSAYTSLASGNSGPPPERQQSNLKGPTVGLALNLPALRTEDNTPGMYLAAARRLDGWIGADVYLSYDLGESESLVKTIMNSARIGELTEDVDTDGNDSSGLITIDPIGGAQFVSVSETQIAAGANGFAVTTAEVSEIGQFQTASETSNGDFELTNVTRPEMGTTAASHNVGDRLVMLEDLVFLPIDIKYAGLTLRFRFVSRGTAVANNETFDVVYRPQFTEAAPISFLQDESGDILLDQFGAYLAE